MFHLFSAFQLLRTTALKWSHYNEAQAFRYRILARLGRFRRYAAFDIFKEILKKIGLLRRS